MDYWMESVTCAFDEAGITATPEQIKDVTGSMQISHENYGLYTGLDEATKGCKSEAEKELEMLKVEIEKDRIWKVQSKPCLDCLGTGQTLDGWGRGKDCMACDGKGRVKN